jgi:transposase
LTASKFVLPLPSVIPLAWNLRMNTNTPCCPNCERQQIEIDSLRAQVAELQRQVAALCKDSSTSSKPPSSDIVKPPKPAPPPGETKRKPGGQPGHPKHERAALPADMLVGPPIEHRLPFCPDCHGNLHDAHLDPRLLQQIDIPDILAFATEHRSYAGWCPACHTVHYAPFPAEVQAAGLVGPRLTTLIAYLKGACHASFGTIRKFIRDVVGVSISRGHLRNVIAKVCEALDGPYGELLEDLRNQGILNVDETGHKQSGERMWTWCFCAKLYTLFKIDPTRSGDVLIEVLGKEFDGVLGCDFFSAYRRYMREFDVNLQFCLAHLIREVKYLKTVADWRDQFFGHCLSDELRKLFGVIHRREQLSETEFQKQLAAARDAVLSCGRLATVGPEGQSIAKRLREYGAGYFRFMTTPGLEPTNNLAEQAIRFVVLDRVVTQGTRSVAGNQWCERIWTVVATCAKQGKSVFDYLHKCVVAHFYGAESPSLLPQGN